jgi:hypothetical protein
MLEAWRNPRMEAAEAADRDEVMDMPPPTITIYSQE